MNYVTYERHICPIDHERINVQLMDRGGSVSILKAAIHLENLGFRIYYNKINNCLFKISKLFLINLRSS